MQVVQMSDFVANFSSCSDMSVLSHIVAHAERSTTTLQREFPSLSFHPKERGRDSGASLPLPLTATASLLLPPSLPPSFPHSIWSERGGPRARSRSAIVP